MEETELVIYDDWVAAVLVSVLMVKYSYSVFSGVVLVLWTAALVVLPLVLPPLPPPPLLVLLVPVFILGVLVFCALSTSKLPDTAIFIPTT